MASVIFSGHMIDGPERSEPRFPADHVPRVRLDLRGVLAGIDDPEAQAFSGAACGGDLLFCEEWLATGRSLHVFLPRSIEAFLDESVRFAGGGWEDMFQQVIANTATTLVGPEEDDELSDDPHTPNNLRMLERAKEGGRPLFGIFVWDGGGGDGPGGTRHMASMVEQAGGHVSIVEP